MIYYSGAEVAYTLVPNISLLTAYAYKFEFNDIWK